MVATFQQIGQSILGRSDTNDLNADSIGQTFAAIPDRYTIYEAAYQGTMYELSSTLLRSIGPQLPVNIQMVHNPTKRVVDWWPGRVYPGVWSEDGLPAQGKPNRIPFAPDTDEAVRRAVQQVFRWGNWGSEILVYVRTGAMIGDVFVEMFHDIDRQKVYPKLIHPRYVKNIEWNASGDVMMYELVIPQRDAKGNAYNWGKRVDKDTITTLRDNTVVERLPNLWGFVPAVWVQHRNLGGQHGSPAIDGVLSKINALNGIVTSINAFILKFIDQYVIIGSDNPEGMMAAITGVPSKTMAQNDDISIAYRDAARVGKQNKVPILGAKGAVSAVRLWENLGLGDAVPHRDRLMEEIEKDLSEITLADKLLDKDNMSAPGAVPLVQDVQSKLDESAGNYDAGLIKMGQMGVSMAAICIEQGVWDRRTLTAQQQLFIGFDSQSYDRGELSFSITPRSLIPDTAEQRINRVKALEGLATAESLVMTGEMDETEAATFVAARDAALDRAEQRRALSTVLNFNAGGV